MRGSDLKAVEAERLIKILVRILAVSSASLPLPSYQPSPQTRVGVTLDDSVCADHSTLIEVARPSAQQRVQFSHSLLDRLQVPSACRFVMDLLDDAFERFTRRLGANEGLAVLSVEPPDAIPEKVEGLFGQARNPGLSIVDRQTQLIQQATHRRKCCRPVAGRTADHEIVSIVDDMGIESRRVAMLVPRQQKAPEVEVGEERRCRSSLGSPPLPIASLCGSKKRVAVRALAHRRPQPLLDHRQDLPVGDSAADATHQRTVRNRGEVIAEISVHDFPAAVFDVKVGPAHRHLRVQLRTKSVLLRSQILVKNRTEHQHCGGLDHAVFYRRDAERSLSTIAFWDPDAQKRLWRITLAPQLFSQRPEPLFLTLGLDRFKVDAIHARRPRIGAATSIRFVQNVFSGNLIPKAIEPIARFGPRFRL